MNLYSIHIYNLCYMIVYAYIVYFCMGFVSEINLFVVKKKKYYGNTELCIIAVYKLACVIFQHSRIESLNTRVRVESPVKMSSQVANKVNNK